MTERQTKRQAERQKLYEGKAKILYASDDPAVLVSYFKDDATAFNAQKRGQIADKGRINCAIAPISSKSWQPRAFPPIGSRPLAIAKCTSKP